MGENWIQAVELVVEGNEQPGRVVSLDVGPGIELKKGVCVLVTGEHGLPEKLYELTQDAPAWQGGPLPLHVKPKHYLVAKGA